MSEELTETNPGSTVGIASAVDATTQHITAAGDSHGTTSGSTTFNDTAAASRADSKSVRWEGPENNTFIDPPNEDDYPSDMSTEILEDEDRVEPGLNNIKHKLTRHRSYYDLRSESPLSNAPDETVPEHPSHLRHTLESKADTSQTKVILRIPRPTSKVLQRADTNISTDDCGTARAKTSMCLTLTAPSDDPDIIEDGVSSNVVPSDKDIDMDSTSVNNALNLNVQNAKPKPHMARAKSLPDTAVADIEIISADVLKQNTKRRLSEEYLVGTQNSENLNKRLKSTQPVDDVTLSNNAQRSISQNWRSKLNANNTTAARTGIFLSPADAATRRSISPGPSLNNVNTLKEASVEIQVASDIEKNNEQIKTIQSKCVTTAAPVQISVGPNLKTSRIKKDPNDNTIKPSNARCFTMSDIKVDHRRFCSVFIQTYYEYYMTLPNPFKVQNQLETIMPAIQEIWNTVFQYEPLQLTVDCSVKYVADQRFIEYHGRIAKVACKTINKFFEKKQAEDRSYDDLWRRNFVSRALGHKSNPPFIWKNFELADFEVKKKGIFCHKFIIETLAYHFHKIRHSDQNTPAIKSNNIPQGALAIAACAVEHTLEMWISGFQQETKLSFSADNYGDRAQFFADLAAPEVLSNKQWNLIFEEVVTVVSIHGTSRSNTPVPQEDKEDMVFNVADIVAMDEDSDLDSHSN